MFRSNLALPASIRSCMLRVLPGREFVAGVARGSDGSVSAFRSGVARCANPFLCPNCAPVLRRRRAQQIADATSRFSSSAFVTLTLQHKANDRLSVKLSELAYAWRCLRESLEFRRFTASGGRYVRVLEVTHGANGFHPHYHVLFLAPSGLSLPTSDFFDSYRSALMRRGLLVVGATVDVRLADVGSASYLAKLGRELTNSGGLDIDVDTPKLREFVSAMRGKRFLVASRGLLVGTDAEVVDELAAGADILGEFDAPADVLADPNVWVGVRLWVESRVDFSRSELFAVITKHGELVPIGYLAR